MTGAPTNPKNLTLKKPDWLCESTNTSLFFNLDLIGAFFALFTLLKLFFELGSGSKTFLGPTYLKINFGFGSTGLSFCFWFDHILDLFFTFFWPFEAIFWYFQAVFGVGVRFKNIFGTYLCSQSTLVLEVQPYLFAFTSAKFGAFFALFGPLGAIFGVEVRFKNIFGTYLHRLTTFILEV